MRLMIQDPSDQLAPGRLIQDAITQIYHNSSGIQLSNHNVHAVEVQPQLSKHTWALPIKALKDIRRLWFTRSLPLHDVDSTPASQTLTTSTRQSSDQVSRGA